jgi:hypothetical protein
MLQPMHEMGTVRRLWDFICMKELRERRKYVVGNEITHSLATSETDPNVGRLIEVARNGNCLTVHGYGDDYSDFEQGSE